MPLPASSSAVRVETLPVTSSARPPDRSYLSAATTAAKELLAAIGFQPGYRRTRRHIELLQHLSRFGIDVSHVAFVSFPGGVPEFAVHPTHAGDETVGLDGAQNRSCLRIDLMNFAATMLPDP